MKSSDKGVHAYAWTKQIPPFSANCLLSALVITLVACGGGGGSSDDEGGGGGGGGGGPLGVTPFELIDPSPGAGDRFGQDIIVLPNGNIVVTDPFDSSVVAGGGAVHLFDPVAQSVISSIYGDNADDNLGSDGLVELTNGNYVIVSTLDDNGGITDAGSIRLVDGASGIEIVSIQGDEPNDRIGLGDAIELPNGNFVVGSPLDNPGGNADAGTVQLFNGATGAVIATVSGDDPGDGIGGGLIIALDNNNVVIQSSTDTNAGVLLAGSVRLINGATGAQLGPTVYGAIFGDALGGGDFAELPNSNYVITSPLEDAGVADAGTIRLFRGTDGLQIGATIAGELLNDRLGFGLVEALPNNNFVVTSLLDDEGGIVDAGSARLVNGLDGSPIVTIAGTSTNEQLGFVTTLPNANFVVASTFAEVGPNAGAGTVRLFNGTTGDPIGPIAAGDAANDRLGFGSTLALPNGNYVVTSVSDDVGGVVDAGSARLFDGATGVQINLFAGDTMTDSIGLGTLLTLQNNNYVVGASVDDEGAVDAGTARLFDGATGVQIGPTLEGDVPGDQIGDSSIEEVLDSRYVVISTQDDEGGVVDAGSVRLMDGSTGTQVGATLAGLAAGDVDEWVIGLTPGQDFIVIGLERFDNNGLVDSGYVFVYAD